MARFVRELMTPDPAFCTPQDSIIRVAQMMVREDCGIIPVVQTEGDRRLAGVITDRDIVLRVVSEGREPTGTPVGEVATPDPVTVDPQQTLDEALRLMAEHQVRRLPVVEEDGRLVGVLAQADVAREATPEQTGQVVEEISE